MQTTLLITAQPGASVLQPLPPVGAGQPFLDTGADGDGFAAILEGNSDPVRSTAEVAEVLPTAVAACAAVFPWPLPVVDGTKAAASAATESEPGLTISADYPSPGHSFSREGVASLLPVDPGLAVPTNGGPEPVDQAAGDPVPASRQGVVGQSPLQDPAPLPNNSSEVPGAVRQGHSSRDGQPPGMTAPPLRSEESPGIPGGDPGSPSTGDARSVVADAGSALRQDATLVPGTPALPLAATADAAIGAASSSGPSGAGVHDTGQEGGSGLDRPLPAVVPKPLGPLGPDPLTAVEDVPKGPDATQNRGDETDQGRTSRDPLSGAGLLGGGETGRLATPASAAECLWRGAALARLAGSDASASTGLSAAQSAGFSSSIDPGNDGVPLRDGHAPLPAGGPTVGPTLQQPQAALWDPRTVPAIDPSLPIEGDGLPDPDLAIAAGIVGATSSLLPLSAAAPPAGTQVPAALAQLSGQITTALAQRSDGATDIALSPDELGRVHMTLQADAQNPDRMVVYLSFDRPETLDLFRRHADQLAEAIRSAGYAGADINFGQSGAGAGGSFGPGAGKGAGVPASATGQTAIPSTNPAQNNAPGAGDPRSLGAGSTTALNLRL